MPIVDLLFSIGVLLIAVAIFYSIETFHDVKIEDSSSADEHEDGV